MAVTESTGQIWAAVRERPNDVGLLCSAAESLLGQGDLPAAHGFATRACELADTSSGPVLLLARVLCRQHKAVDAADLLNDRVAKHRDEPGFLLQLAACEALAGNDAGARRALHDALVLWPDDGATHAELGAFHRRQGERRLALAHFGAALAADPAHAAAAAGRRELSNGDEQSVALESAYADALALDPGDFAAIAMLARRHLDQDRYAAAGNLLVRMLELDHVRARTFIDTASERLRQATAGDQLQTGSPAALFARHGLLHHVVQQKDQAKTCYEQALMRDPGSAFARAMLAALNRGLGLPDLHDAFGLDAMANAERNREELLARATVLESTPTGMEVASTNVCNIDPPCVQCWKHIDPAHGWLNSDSRHLPRDLIERIAPFVRRTRRVTLHGIGEPLANPHLFDTVRWCEPATEVAFVSNALLLNDARIKKVLDQGVGMIDFSLDAGTAETFRKIRHNDFAKATGNIRRLVQERDRRGLNKPRVGINMCLMRANVGDVPAFVRLAHDLGANVAHIFHMNHGAKYRFEWFDYEEQLCDRDPETHDRFVEEGFALAQELGVNLHMSGRRRLAVPDDERRHAGGAIDTKRFFCPKPWDALLVQVDGSVFNCCWQASPIGNLERQSIWEVWNGKLLQDVRRSTALGVPHAACVSPINPCPYLGRT